MYKEGSRRRRSKSELSIPVRASAASLQDRFVLTIGGEREGVETT
jgi:hypothetical protein